MPPKPNRFEIQIQPESSSEANSPRQAAAALLRLPMILAPNGPIPVSKSTWWAGVKSGRYPQPVKLGPGITAWRRSDIERLILSGAPL